MNFYPENQLVEITVPYTDRNGEAVTPTTITAVLLNGEGDVLMNYGTVAFNAGDQDVKIVIPAIANTLQGDDLQEVRRLSVTITHAVGVFSVSQAYVIEAEQSLQIMRNSFMTYDTALMLSTGFVNATAFVSASDERRRAALVEAFYRIIRFTMTYNLTDTDGKVMETHRIVRDEWPLITADVFQTQFPTHFKRALRSAQILEADELLEGNVLARKHAQGIASETIGESSVSLRAGFGSATAGGLSSAALDVLSGYIDRTVRIGRA